MRVLSKSAVTNTGEGSCRLECAYSLQKKTVKIFQGNPLDDSFWGVARSCDNCMPSRKETVSNGLIIMNVATEIEVITRALAPLQSILFVEDESHDFIIARYRLEQMNVRNPIIHVPTFREMFAFLDGEEGYSDRVKYPLPAVIVLGVRSPNRSGIDAQAAARSSLRYRKIPIISISGYNRMAVLQQSVELGVNSCMAKSFEPADFLAIVARLNLPVRFNSLSDRIRN